MRKQKSNGFTIVETLIVLAVTGVLFLATAMTVSGQINRYRYRDAITRLEGLVQGSINNTQAGYYSRDTGASGQCDNVGPGESTQCVIVGQMIDFNATNYTATPIAITNGTSFTDTANVLKFVGNAEVREYPGGLGLKSSNPFVRVYVVYKTAVSASTYVGGSQSVEIYKADRTTNSASTKVCLSDGSRNGAITIGGQYGLVVKTTALDDHVGCS